MTITYIIISCIIALLLVDTINYGWQLDELHAKKRDEIARLQSEIITTLLNRKKGDNLND